MRCSLCVGSLARLQDVGGFEALQLAASDCQCPVLSAVERVASAAVDACIFPCTQQSAHAGCL